MLIRIAGTVSESIVDGPGIRYTIFTQGCPHHCEGCHNPETHDFGGGRLADTDKIYDHIAENPLLKGVTFSGGEPLAQKEFLSECIDKCKEKNINCAVETSLIYYDEKIFKKLDFVMADLKIWNSDLHKEYTGVGNESITENFKRLNTLGIPIIARTPVIPDGFSVPSKEYMKELEKYAYIR